MKLFAFLSILSFARGGHYDPAPLNHDGTVADTHEVALLKAKHLSELAKAGGDTVYAPHYGDEHYESNWIDHPKYVETKPKYEYSHTPIYTHYEKSSYHSPLSYVTYASKHFEPAPLKHDGTVDDTPEIKHAKAVHFAAHEAAKSYYPIQTYLADTPEVEHAKALHFAAYHKALHRAKRAYEIYESHGNKYHGPPAPLKHDGTVDDTPEVKHAKAEHFAAHAAAKYGAYHTPAQYAEPVQKLHSYNYQPVYQSHEPVYESHEPVYESHEPVFHQYEDLPYQHFSQY